MIISLTPLLLLLLLCVLVKQQADRMLPRTNHASFVKQT